MVANCAGQDSALDVTSLANEVGRGVAVADPLDVLVDDRPLVEVAGDVMRGRADQLDPALMGLMVRAGALEPRQERTDGY